MELILATFLRRINRFVVEVEIEGKPCQAYLPNPGRLWELLIPGRLLYLTPQRDKNYPYLLLAAIKKGKPVLLHTHLTNSLIKKLLLKKALPMFSEYELIKEEPKIGRSRFDFLLVHSKSEEKLFLEVKTCTLFGERLALFPDAETERGTRHLLELAQLAKEGNRGACLFVVMNPNVEYFLPAYHIDSAFTQAFLQTFSLVKYWAIAVELDPTFTEIKAFKPLKIPVEMLQKENLNGGIYLLLIYLENAQDIAIGSTLNTHFERGYYIYVGSAKNNLIQRIRRHRHKRKTKHWHIDYFLERAKLLTTIPIVSRESLECSFANALGKIAERSVKGFGASDCLCPSHLFYFSHNPLLLEPFIELLNYYRLEKPLQTWAL